jgi:4-amino-4-deoxy-L-arabinose transferase-like glycosyltransferase
MRRPPDPVPQLGWRAGSALALVAFGIRAAVVLATGPSQPRFADALPYLFAARSLASTGTYPLRTEAFLFRPPGYPFFLAVATLGHPESIAACRLATAAAGALVPVVLAALSARLFRRRGLAIATGALAAVHPAFVLVSIGIQTEALFLLFLLVSGFLLLAAADRPSSNLAILSGAGLALAALTRSSALALVPFLAAPLFDSRHPRRVNAHVVGSALLGFVLVLGPWTARNALLFRELIVVNDGAGYLFYGRKSEAALGVARARDRAELRQAAAELERARARIVESLPADVRDSPGKLSRALTDAALAERRADPAGTFFLLGWETWSWLRPYPDPRFWPRSVVVGLGVDVVILDLVAVIGLTRGSRRGCARFCVAFLAVTMLFHVAMGASWRYRTTSWDPILILYGAFGALTLRAGRPSPENAAT